MTPITSEPRFINLYRLVPAFAFILFWEIACRSNPKRVFFFGLPSKILAYLVAKTADGSLVTDFIVTFSEALAGFILGNLVGTLVGVGLWYSRRAFLISKPYIIALGSAPIFAIAPLMIIWFGTGVFSKVMMAMLSTVFVALFQAYSGAAEASADYISLMKTFGASKHQVFRKVVAPSAVVWVIAALRLNIGFALLGAFIGEFISSTRGLGHLILVASGLFDISLVLCGVLLLVFIALLLNFLISQVEPPLKRLLMEWL